jgi:hypothetical protein
MKISHHKKKKKEKKKKKKKKEGMSDGTQPPCPSFRVVDCGREPPPTTRGAMS